MKEMCAVGKLCDGVCRESCKDYEKCPAFYIEQEKKVKVKHDQEK